MSNYSLDYSAPRCVVEDGTGEAQLYVYDDMVATVLKLSTEEWRHLQELAMRTGELMYQRHKWFSGNSRPKVKLTSEKKNSKVSMVFKETVDCRNSRVFVVTLVRREN